MSIKLLLGVSAGIAAYKIPLLIRRLKEHDIDVRVVMTASSQQFVTKVTLQAVSGQRVYSELFDENDTNGMDHIALARWADQVLIAPATANIMAKLANGIADDLLTTICLATNAPVALAPAMNQQMWLDQTTQKNLRRLQESYYEILGPAAGEQACGEIGYGRMLEPEELLHFVLSANQKPLRGKKILITAGPTLEVIDPVRYMSNYSSGKMGYALAQQAKRMGAEVTLISGPTALQAPDVNKLIDVTSADQMYNAVHDHIQQQDVFIATAAVADYRVAQPAAQKIKKSDTMTLSLLKNPDILKSVADLKKRPFIIGFAAETEHVVDNAKKKLNEKNIDLIIANDVSNGRVFAKDESEVYIIDKEYVTKLPCLSKVAIASEILTRLV